MTAVIVVKLKGRFKVDAFKFKPSHSGFLFLCSDGVSDYVNRKSLELIFIKSKNIGSLSELITQSVMDTEAGDNFSFVLIQYELSWMNRWRNKFKI